MIATTLSQLVRPAQTTVRHAPFSASAALWKGKTVTREDEASAKLLRLQSNSPLLFWILVARARGVGFEVFSFKYCSETSHRSALESFGFVEPDGEIAPKYADVLKKWFSSD